MFITFMSFKIFKNKYHATFKKFIFLKEKTLIS